MSTKPLPSAFNIAPHAPKFRLRTWVALAVASGLAFTLACGAVYVAKTNEGLQDQIDKQQRLNRRKAAQERRDMSAEADPAKREQLQAATQLQRMSQVSWDGLFDALEVATKAVSGGVSISSLVPAKIEPDNATVNVTAWAANAPIMLAYVRNLAQDPRLRRIDILMQQPDEKVGPQVVRFQLALLWNPLSPPPAAAAVAPVVGAEAVKPPNQITPASSKAEKSDKPDGIKDATAATRQHIPTAKPRGRPAAAPAKASAVIKSAKQEKK